MLATQLDTLTMSHACHAMCMLPPFDAALTLGFAGLTPHNTIRLKCCACHEKCTSSSANDAKVWRLPQKTSLDTYLREAEVCSFPHRHGETTRETRKSRGDMCALQNEHFVGRPQIFILCSFKNWCFLTQKLTKCHACHRICTLSPLDASLTMWLAKKATSHV